MAKADLSAIFVSKNGERSRKASLHCAKRNFTQKAQPFLHIFTPSHDVATTLNGLADLHKELTRFAEAEQEYQEALAIYRDLAKTVPEIYEAKAAKTLNALAVLHSGSSIRRIMGILFSRRVRERVRMAKAERSEALAIAKKYPDDPDCKKILEG